MNADSAAWHSDFAAVKASRAAVDEAQRDLGGYAEAYVEVFDDLGEASLHYVRKAIARLVEARAAHDAALAQIAERAS